MLNLPLSGDIFVEFKSKGFGHQKSKTMCYFWFNTAFIDGNEFVLQRQDVDRAHLDKKGKKFNPHFQIELSFALPGELPSPDSSRLHRKRASAPGTTFEVESTATSDQAETVDNPVAQKSAVLVI